MEDFSKMKKDDLIIALEQSNSENVHLRSTLDRAMTRLTQSETRKVTGEKLTNIDAGKGGEYIFHGTGINTGGRYYSAEELKNNPDVAIALFESGSDLIKKLR